MKSVADTMGIARSNLIERMNRSAKVRGRYRKDDDEALAVLIRRLVDERPSYGYRRIAALVNRQRWADGKPRINAKRVLRIMQVNHLTLERHTGRRPGRAHDGVVIALCSNVRWCSDHLELACRNQDVVRVLFAIDACDREIMAWAATTAGISGEMVRDLMVACVERRFGATKTPHPIECCPITAAPISPRTLLMSRLPWVCVSASPRFVRQSPTASAKPSSKRSNAIMLVSRSCQMPRR